MMKTDKKNKKVRKESPKIYGQELILDLYDCDPRTIRSGKRLAEYPTKLCRLIKMKKYGKTIVERFALYAGHAAGYSLVQLIETSLISGHFSELWNRAYINIFSCKKFDTSKAEAFTKKFFNAKKVKRRILIR
jgi:S-adenosylmethionine/arginine decarboxylase-like enzyme